MKKVVMILLLFTVSITGYSQLDLVKRDIRVQRNFYLQNIPSNDTAILFVKSDGRVDTISTNDLAGIVLNEIINDTSLWNSLITELSQDTTLINNIAYSLSTDTSFLNAISSFLQTDTNLFNAISNFLQTDTSLFLSVSNYLQSDTALFNAMQQYLSNDTSLFNFTNNTYYNVNLDSLLANDSSMFAYLDSLISAHINDSLNVFSDRWIRNQQFGAPGLQSAYARITGPFVIDGFLKSKYLVVSDANVGGGGSFTVIGNSQFKGTTYIEPDNLGWPENVSTGGRRGYFLANTAFEKWDGRVKTLKLENGYMRESWTRLDSLNFADSFFIQYCNGCALESGYLQNGDTLVIDTTVNTCGTTRTSGDTLFLCSDTIVMYSNGYWTKAGNKIHTSGTWFAGINNTNPQFQLHVGGTSFSDGTMFAKGANGDADGNGGVFANDALAVGKFLFNKRPWSNNLVNGDADGDGLLTLQDASAIIKRFTMTYPTDDSMHNQTKRLTGSVIASNDLIGSAKIPRQLIVGSRYYTDANTYSANLDSVPAITGTGRTTFLSNPYFNSSLVIDYSKSLVQKMNTGRIGIGTGNPSAKLDVNGYVKIDSLAEVTDAGALFLARDPATKIIGWKAPTSGSSSTSPMSNNIYVDVRSGNDATARRGDITRPFLTLRAAIDSFAIGSCIVVFPGTYNVELTSNSNEGLNLIRKSDGTYIDGIKYYFYPGARVIKSGAKELCVGTTTIETKILGYGTFIKNTTASSITFGTVFNINGPIHIQYDTIMSTVGQGVWIQNSTVRKYCKMSGNFLISSASSALIVGDYTTLNIDGGTISTTASTYSIQVNGSGTLSESAKAQLNINSRVIGAVSGYALIFMYRTNLTGTVDISDWTNAASQVFYVYDLSYIDVSVKNQTPTTSCILIENIYRAYANIRLANCNGTMVIKSSNIGTIRINREQSSLLALSAIVTSGKIYITGGDFLGNAVNGTTTFDISGGTLYLIGPFSLGECFYSSVISGTGTLSINGKIDITLSHYNVLGSIIMKTGSTLILESGCQLKFIDNNYGFPGIEIQGSVTIIDKGCVIQSGTTNYSIRAVTGVVASTDTVAVTYYNITSNSFANKPIYSCARNQGGNLWFQDHAGYDYSAANKTFQMSSKTQPTTQTITLDANCTTVQQQIDHINAKLSAAGITDVICGTGTAGDNRYIEFRTKPLGTYQEYYTLGSGTAVTLWGMTAKQYKSSIYKQISEGGNLIVDPKIKIY